MRTKLAWGGGALFGALLALLLVVFPGIPSAIAQNVDCYMQQGGNKFVCDNGGEIELQTGAVLDIQSGATASIDDLTVVDDLILTTGTLRWTPSTTQTVTMNDAITVDGPTTLLTSAGTVNTSNVACGSHGDFVLYVNVGAQSIVITDTGTLRLSGNTTLGASGDNLLLHNIWGTCHEVAQADN